MAIFGRSPKTRIFWKKAKGRPRETFKKSPKKYPSLQRAKSTLAKMSLSSNLYPLILQRLEKILAHKAALKLPEWPSYGNFCKVTQNRIFCKSAKGGQRKIFQKSPKKKPSYNNFCKVTQNPHFLKKCKGWTKGNFSKIAQKVALVWKAQKHTGANGIFL